jgi:acetyl esterase/lipase
LAPANRWPAQIEDAKCAIRFLRAEAGNLGVDPTRIGVMGASAGGQLAAMVGLTGESPLFSTADYPNESSAVEAVVDEYGPTDLTSPDLVHSKALRTFAEETFGEAAGRRSSVLASASPMTYVHHGAPPFLVVQGAEDDIVIPSQSTELVNQLERAHDVSKLIVVSHAGHGLVQQGSQPIAPSLSTLVDEVTSFLTRKLPPHS